MSIEIQTPSLAPAISSLLAGLRCASVATCGLKAWRASASCWELAFWGTLAFDWLFEPPWQFRAVMLAAAAAALLYVVYRQIARRAFYRLDDSSLALVLERRYPEYRDSLLTTVEIDRHPSHASSFNRDMVDFTRRQAVVRSKDVRLGEVFRLGPLVRTLSLAIVLVVSVLTFAVAAHAAYHTWYQRVVMLNRDLLWPRSNHVRVEGFPADRIRKVAKGADFELLAAADLHAPFKLPHYVEVRYRTDEGVHNQDNMSTRRQPRLRKIRSKNIRTCSRASCRRSISTWWGATTAIAAIGCKWSTTPRSAKCSWPASIPPTPAGRWASSRPAPSCNCRRALTSRSTARRTKISTIWL